MLKTKYKRRIIALYLPQFHPIQENDIWWGKGFTEWTNTAKAKPLYRGHYQPHLPADLGFYDLRLSESRIAQAELASEYGIEAFCYYHYWFAGRRILERPFNEVLASGKPDFPFCLCWANETWSGIWHGSPQKVLIEQTYPGVEDYKRHFDLLLEAFSDSRYLTVDGKPVFLIYRPQDLPDPVRITDLWREMAFKRGFPGLHLIGFSWRPDWVPEVHGFDAAIRQLLPNKRPWISRKKPFLRFRRWIDDLQGKPTIYPYSKMHLQMIADMPNYTNYPCLIPNWDNTPRSGKNGMVLHGSTPELFRQQVKKAIEVTNNVDVENNLIFVKSWNEWAEGNHLEPDLKFGKSYLEVLKDELSK